MMTFEQAKLFKLRWGKYRDVEFQDVVSTREGVQYLVWLNEQEFPHKVIKEAINAMLQELDKETEITLPPGKERFFKPETPKAKARREIAEEEDDDDHPF